MAEIPDETVTEIKYKLAEHKKNGYLPLLAKEKFERAEMSKEYKTIFKMLSGDSHNSLTSLIRRHVAQKDDDLSILIYKATTPQDSAMFVAFIAEYFMRATEKLHDFLSSEVMDKVAEYRSMLNEFNIEAEMQAAEISRVELSDMETSQV